MRSSDALDVLSIHDAFCCVVCCVLFFFLLMIRLPPRSTLDRSSAASDVYKRQGQARQAHLVVGQAALQIERRRLTFQRRVGGHDDLSLIHISEPTRPY